MELEILSGGTLAVFMGLVAAFGFFAWRNPVNAARAILFLLPIYLIRIRQGFPYPTNALEMLIGAFVLAALLRVLLKKDSFISISNNLKYPLGLIVTGALIGTLYGIMRPGVSVDNVLEILGTLKGFIVVPVVFVYVVASLKSLRLEMGRILEGYVWSAVIVAAISVFQIEAVSGFLTYDGRLRGFYISPNHLAMYVMPAILLIIGKLKRKNKRENIGEAAKIAILGTALLLTQSLGAIIGAGAGVFMFFVLRSRKRFSKTIIFYSLFFILVAGLLIPLIGASFADTAWDVDWRSPIASRLMIWRVSVEMLSDNWFIGIGPGAFQQQYLELQEAFPQYLEWAVPMPHNLWLAFWLQAGILGLIGFVWLVWGALRRIPKDGYEITVSVALTAILVHGFVDTPFFKNDLAVIFLILVVLRLLEDARTQ